MRVPSYLYHTSSWLSNVSLNLAILIRIKWNLRVVLTFISLISKIMEYSFEVSLSHFSSFENSLLRSIPHFSLDNLYFWLFVEFFFKTIFLILYVNHAYPFLPCSWFLTFPTLNPYPLLRNVEDSYVESRKSVKSHWGRTKVLPPVSRLNKVLLIRKFDPQEASSYTMINPGPTAGSPINCPSQTASPTFTGPCLVQCTFPSCQSRMSSH